MPIDRYCIDIFIRRVYYWHVCLQTSIYKFKAQYHWPICIKNNIGMFNAHAYRYIVRNVLITSVILGSLEHSTLVTITLFSPQFYWLVQRHAIGQCSAQYFRSVNRPVGQ